MKELFFKEIKVADFLKPYFEKDDWYLLPGQIKDILEANITETSIESEAHNLIHTGKVHIGKNCILGDNIVISGPVYIGDGVEISTGAYLRAGSYVGNECSVGHAAQLRNVIMMDGSKVANHCYAGDSILGAKARIGGHCETANRRFDQQPVVLNIAGQKLQTNLDKYGAIIGEGSRLGGGVFTDPGSAIGYNTFIETMTHFGGYIEPNKFVKVDRNLIIKDNNFTGELHGKSRFSLNN